MSNVELFVSEVYTEPNGFTRGIEGPACDKQGNLYAVSFSKEHTIGMMTPSGECSLFLELPEESSGNGIRFNKSGDMFIADYTGHNILKVDMTTKEVSVYAHEPSMSQPNDIAITDDGVIFASDPNWKQSTGRIWRIDLDGSIHLLQTDMGTTNGIEVSADGKRLYVNESHQRRIWVLDILADRTITNKRLLIEFPDFGMDGMRCDIEGNLYVTRFEKGTVLKLSPDGEVLREITLTGLKPSNLTFGGVDGRTCYVTIADRGNIERFFVDVPGRCWSTLR